MKQTLLCRTTSKRLCTHHLWTFALPTACITLQINGTGSCNNSSILTVRTPIPYSFQKTDGYNTQESEWKRKRQQKNAVVTAVQSRAF